VASAQRGDLPAARAEARHGRAEAETEQSRMDSQHKVAVVRPQQSAIIAKVSLGPLWTLAHFWRVQWS
jgi:hypothetical protein